MLTKNERKWLQERVNRKAPCGEEWWYCDVCTVKTCCGMIPDWQDTAKFEARVAIVAANGAQPCLQDDCPYGHERDCNRFSTYATQCGLKHARLYVEEEMEP